MFLLFNVKEMKGSSWFPVTPQIIIHLNISLFLSWPNTTLSLKFYNILSRVQNPDIILCTINIFLFIMSSTFPSISHKFVWICLLELDYWVSYETKLSVQCQGRNLCLVCKVVKYKEGSKRIDSLDFVFHI